MVTTVGERGQLIQIKPCTKKKQKKTVTDIRCLWGQNNHKEPRGRMWRKGEFICRGREGKQKEAMK